MKLLIVLSIFVILSCVIKATEGGGSGGVAANIGAYLTKFREKQKIKEAALKRKTTPQSYRPSGQYSQTYQQRPTKTSPVYCQEYGVRYGYGYRTNGFGYGYGPCVSWY